MTAHNGIRVRLSGGPRVISVVSDMFAIPKPPAWQEAALCAQTDPDRWHPETGCSTTIAKTICHSCEVESTCLEYAMERRERHGVWGGLSERERRKLATERNREAS